MVLPTTGKGVANRTGVFGLTVTTQNGAQLSTPTPVSVAVSYNQITAMGQPLDSDGTTYVVLPYGTVVPVPVMVPGSISFTYIITPTLYQLNLYANIGGAVVNDKTTQILAGQMGNLVCSIDPKPNQFTVTEITWSITGPAIGTYVYTGSQGYTMPWINGSSILSWYWTDAVQDATVTCNVQAVVDGKTFSFNASTHYQVLKPDAQFSATIESPVLVDFNNYLDMSGWYMHLGGGNTGPVGMLLSY